MFSSQGRTPSMRSLSVGGAQKPSGFNITCNFTTGPTSPVYSHGLLISRNSHDGGGLPIASATGTFLYGEGTCISFPWRDHHGQAAVRWWRKRGAFASFS